MPRTTRKVPSYRLHKASGQAVVSLNGKDIYLGKHGSAESRDNYDKVIAEWLANHKLPPASSRTGARTIDSLIDVHQLFVAYYDYAQVYYLKDGKKTGEVANIEHAARPLNELFGSMFVIDFRPTHLKAVRQRMIEANLCRKTVNNRINRIRRLFKWGVENDMVPPDVLHALQAVAPLRRGRCGVREGDPVRPVPEATINACMPFLPEMVQAMIRVQEFTGMRPGELVIMRTRDLDTTGKVWIYQPESHKTDHYGHERHIYIGARAQEYLKGYLLTDLDAYIFSPRRAQEERWAACKHHRRQVNLDRKTKRKLGDRYTSATYLRAIYYACERAWPAPEPLCRMKTADGRLESYQEWQDRLKKEKLTDQLRQWRRQHFWHPHQLRHNAATYLRKQFGVETARVVLGHRSAAVTEIFDGSRKMLDEKWTYWKGPRFASSLPIKWKIVDDPVDKGTVLQTDDPAAAGGKYGAADVVTKKEYKDFRLHVEFLVMKNCGNSGVYLQNRYEIQILDGDKTKHGMDGDGTVRQFIHHEMRL